VPALVVLALIGLSLAWRFTALGQYVQLDAMVARAEAMRKSRAALLAAPLLFVVLSLLLVPITLLRATTVIAFGPILGPIYALVGSTVAALVGYEIGRHAGGPAFQRFAGPRVERIRARIAGGGVLAMAALRLVPLGPFTFVNAACGAASIQRRDFMWGTILVMIPVLILMALAVSLVPALAGTVLPMA